MSIAPDHSNDRVKKGKLELDSALRILVSEEVLTEAKPSVHLAIDHRLKGYVSDLVLFYPINA